MKKSILVLALAALASGARAGEVSAEQACAAVEAWRVSNGLTFGDLGAAVSATPMRDTDGTLLWYVVSTSNGGTVVTAGDDRVEPIMAVLPKEDFGGVIPSSHPLYGFMKMDIRGRLAAAVSAKTVSGGGASLLSVAPAQETLSVDALAAQARWARLSGSGAALQATGSGGPAMIFGYIPGFSDGTLTHWNQGSSTQSQGEALYNYYTPSHYVCGCVATAGAAILQYFNVTNGPVAYTNACTFNGTQTNLVTIGGHYDWSILPKGMGGKATNPIEILTDEQRELLGRVAYDMGVCVGMGYDVNGTASGAYESMLAKAFKENFGFATATHVAFEGDKKKEAKYYDRFIYNQLRCGAPVGLGIAGPAGGHSVLAVGYGEDFAGTPYTRVFMGWGGSGDAWYNLPDITDYPFLIDVITELSLDGNSVPVCGRVVVPNGSVPSVEHSADGLIGAALVPVEVSCGDLVVTNYSGANGCFAVRVPAETAGKVKCGDQEIAFGPAEEESGEEGEEESGEEEGGEEMSELEKAYSLLPETMSIKLAADAAVPTYPTPAAAESMAYRKTSAYPDGRMVILVSGRQGDEKTAAFMDVLAKVIDPETFNQSCVLYYADYDTDGYGLFNSYPAIAAFNSAVYDPGRGWAINNGCLGSLAADEEVPTEEDMAEFLATVNATWMRLTGNLVLSVQSITEGDYDALNGAAPAADFSPALGLVTTLTNGETVVASVAPVCTNFEKGVVSKCIGWQLFQGTNVTSAAIAREQELRAYVTETDPMELAIALYKNEDLLAELLELGLVELVDVDGVQAAVAVDPLPESVYTPVAEGAEATAEFTMDYPEMSLIWKWEDAAYRVRASAHREGGMPGDGYGTVDFDEDWVEPGTEITITATGALVGGSQKALTELKGWSGLEEEDVRDGCTLTFTVTSARFVEAIFNKGKTIPANTPKFGVAVDVIPADLKAQEGFPLPKSGSVELVYGQNAELFFQGQQGAVTLAATSFTDTTGGVWRCVGWQAGTGDIAETGSVARVSFTATQESAVTFVWEAGESEDVPLDLELTWSDGLDNLASGDDVPAGQNVLVAKAALPKSFNIADYSAADVKNTLKGWTVTGLKLDTTGNLVAVLATNNAVLVPIGVGNASPISIASNGDGTVTVSSTVANAAKGFWYSLYAAEELTGPWTVVSSGYMEGVPSVQATVDASDEDALELSIVVDPETSRKFYKLVVTEKDPTQE